MPVEGEEILASRRAQRLYDLLIRPNEFSRTLNKSSRIPIESLEILDDPSLCCIRFEELLESFARMPGDLLVCVEKGSGYCSDVDGEEDIIFDLSLACESRVLGVILHLPEGGYVGLGIEEQLMQRFTGNRCKGAGHVL